MDDLTFSARRASTAATARPDAGGELETRFKTLVQSPLRAGILRYLSARPDESFDVESLMQTFGRLRLDVENCVRELADFGVARVVPGSPPRYAIERPANDTIVDLLDQFLERRANVSTEDQSPSVQRFRVLEERRFERLGGHKSISVDFRLISATNRPLEQFVRDGRFREDLYYRVNAFAIRLPSLRERQVDIPVLAQRFLARYCAAQGLPLDNKAFSREALDLLVGYHWPGNIRELESTVSRAALSAPGRTIRASDVEFLHASTSAPQPSGEHMPTLAESERALIVRVLEAAQWNKKEAARLLDISRGTLYRKIVEYQLEPEARPATRRTRETEV